jgi:hypothetical protein
MCAHATGFDARHHSREFAHLAAAVFASEGIKVGVLLWWSVVGYGGGWWLIAATSGSAAAVAAAVA